MPRYVILEHDYPVRHWDFMLEAGDVLRTWRLTSEPKMGLVIPVEKSFDHRLIYLEYEGPISDGRGSVARWDSGSYQAIVEENQRLVVRLEGIRLKGEAILTWMNQGNGSFDFKESDREF
jgi:hypothetical protein